MSSIEDLFQEIGRTATALADGLDGRLILYSEVQEGVVSADLFYVDERGDVRYRSTSNEFKKLIYDFWEAWRLDVTKQEWRTMEYVVENGSFNIDFKYPDQINSKDGLPSRRPKVIKKYFEGLKVDYSRP